MPGFHLGAMDVCTAPISSPYFMLTNAYHRLAPAAEIMVTADGRPQVPYVHATSKHCTDYPSSLLSMDRARHFNAGAYQHVQDMEIVYVTPFRDDFCRRWNALGLVDSVPLFHDPSLPQGPTASEYLAFHNTTGSNMYALSDKLVYGHQAVFLRSPNHNSNKGLVKEEANELNTAQRLPTEQLRNPFVLSVLKKKKKKAVPMSL